MSYEIHNMHWYKDKPTPDFSWYVGRPQVGQDWPILANPFVSSATRTRFEVIEPADYRYWNRYRREPQIKNNIVFLSDDPIADFRRWLWYQIRLPGVVCGLINDMARHGDGILLCWCAPKPCHAEVIARAIDWDRRQWDRLGVEDS